jgi:hypothetical protein
MTVSSCGGSSEDGTPFNDNAGRASAAPWEKGGSLTMSEANQIGGEVVSIFETPLTLDRSRTDLAVGESPWRHPDGTLYYLTACGQRGNYVAVLGVNGNVSVASPCSETIANSGYSPTYFTHVMASPNHRRMAVETRWYDRDLQAHYDTTIFEDDVVIASYTGFFASAWLDDDTLLMSSYGLHTAVLGSEPTLLNSEITEEANNPDVSPDGNRIVFEWKGDIWMMFADGTGLRKLADEAQNLRYPVWSPDGQYIAFMMIRAPDVFDHLIIPGDPLNYAYLANANERFIYFVQPDTLERWWWALDAAMADDKMPQGQLSWHNE